MEGRKEGEMLETWWKKLNGGSEINKNFLKLKYTKQLTNNKTY